MTGQISRDQTSDPHPDDEEKNHPVGVKGRRHAAREVEDNKAVNGYTHDDKGKRTGGKLRPGLDEDRSAK